MKIAFVTSQEDGLTQDDRIALEPLRRLGIAVEPWVWDGHDAYPRGFDMLILRSCWDYHRKHRRFEEWVRGLETAGTPVWNPVRAMLWSLDKKYLLDMASRGARVPRTKWFPAGAGLSESDVLFGDGIRSVVVKPAISLNGFDTALFDADDLGAIRSAATGILKDRGVLIQEYVPEIETIGETSLVYFDGVFSHAIRKTPKAGEFRVHVEHGGSRAVIRPTDAVIGQAGRMLRMVGEPLLYARVDGVEVGGELILMELEIIDPMLFLAYDHDAPGLFAGAIRRRLSDDRRVPAG